MLSKDNEANVFLKRAFHDHGVLKIYQALARGRIDWERQDVDAPLGPSPTSEVTVSTMSAGRRPGRKRQSSRAEAVPGMTLCLYPACSTVGLAVFCSVAPTQRAVVPRAATRASGSSVGSGVPVISSTPTRNRRTVGVTSIGQRWLPTAVTAAASRVTAFSVLICDP